MSQKDVELLAERLMSDVRSYSESGSKIVARPLPIDGSSLRAAANQFRQAAIVLDQLDGMEQTLYLLRDNKAY